MAKEKIPTKKVEIENVLDSNTMAILEKQLGKKLFNNFEFKTLPEQRLALYANEAKIKAAILATDLTTVAQYLNTPAPGFVNLVKGTFAEFFNDNNLGGNVFSEERIREIYELFQKGMPLRRVVETYKQKGIKIAPSGIRKAVQSLYPEANDAWYANQQRQQILEKIKKVEAILGERAINELKESSDSNLVLFPRYIDKIKEALLVAGSTIVAEVISKRFQDIVNFFSKKDREWWANVYLKRTESEE